MSAWAAAPAIACGILILSIVVAMVLIRVLDAEMRRATARRAAVIAKLPLPENMKDRVS